MQQPWTYDDEHLRVCVRLRVTTQRANPQTR